MLAFRAEERRETGIRMVMLSTLFDLSRSHKYYKKEKTKGLLTNSNIFRIPAGVLKTIVLQVKPIFEFVVPVLVVVELQKSTKVGFQTF